MCSPLWYEEHVFSDGLDRTWHYYAKVPSYVPIASTSVRVFFEHQAKRDIGCSGSQEVTPPAIIAPRADQSTTPRSADKRVLWLGTVELNLQCSAVSDGCQRLLTRILALARGPCVTRGTAKLFNVCLACCIALLSGHVSHASSGCFSQNAMGTSCGPVTFRITPSSRERLPCQGRHWPLYHGT